MGATGRFDAYIGIDYSGAQTPTASLKALRVFGAEGDSAPGEVPPPPSPRKYWTRKAIAEWLVDRLLDDWRIIVGIDHAFSFPLQYFKKHRLPHDWPAFLDDFQRHWPTDHDHMYVDFIRDGFRGNGAARTGYRRWRRVTEQYVPTAKSVFWFDVQGSVAKSTHAGLPWLRFIRRQAGHRVHFWPFDGWTIPDDRSALVEVYPRLWNRSFLALDLTPDQRDAFSVAAWLQLADRDGRLAAALNPDLSAADRRAAEIEGWILGVTPVAPTVESGGKGATTVAHSPPSPEGRGGKGVRTTRRWSPSMQRLDDAHVESGRTVGGMPEISRFLGIVIKMYFIEHGVPHFHAVYGDREISVEMQSGRVHGSFPPRALRLVLEWAKLHEAELLANWERAARKEPLLPIEPLE
jgi:hypothetical protein